MAARRLAIRFSTVLLALCLTAPTFFGFIWAAGEKQACEAAPCCAKGSTCARGAHHAHQTSGGTQFSRNAGCPSGCAQLPGLTAIALAMPAVPVSPGHAAPSEARFVSAGALSGSERFKAFDLFERPPPSL